MNDDQAGKLLHIIIRDIATVLSPELSSPRAQFTAGAVTSLLQAIAAAGTEPNISNTRTEGAGADLAALLAVAEARRGHDAAGDRDSAYSESGSGLQRSVAAASGTLPPIQADELIAYLKARNANDHWPDRAEIRQVAGGFSKQTFLVELSGAGHPAQSIVLRRDLPFAPLRSSVTDEYRILKAVGERGLAVPRVLWCEADAGALGAATLAVERVAGTCDATTWSADPAIAAGVIRQTAQLLASLHQLPVDELPATVSRVPGAVGTTPPEMVADIQSYWNQVRFEPNALVDGLFDWLHAHAPAGFVRRALVHGDFGFHNLLIADGRIQALLDWEFVHVGDAAEDLAYARPFVEKLVAWDDFRALYRQYGGVDVDAGTMRFYAVLGTLRVAIGCFAILDELYRGDARLDSKLVYVGHSFGEQFAIDAARTALSPSD
ncbi:MAG: hypothetical protein JWQ90_3964 [Hydrocarboniphaga sp.]|uniref:phosphotransferase family protein n=1 Tax=Hydrocarboniphaga sp. TaxID=2033016 RepID=UPI002639C856|nr:phosphotransferase family protein [Hydrocarboniphaga sp.]MDB5971514.1 hypothetical protein [Hydrocarboniphaga sp.]